MSRTRRTDGARGACRPREAGVTLVELMVVLVFVAVGVLTLSFVQTHSFTDVYSTGRHTRALNLAQLHLETARAAGFTLAVSDSGASDGFTWTCYVTPVETGLNQVTSTVTWTEDNQTRTVRLFDLLAAR